MDILVIAAESSERTERFARFVAEDAHRAVSVALGARLPSGLAPLGAVYFDQGEGNLPERIGEACERLRYLGVPLVLVTQRDKQEVPAGGADLLCDPGTPDALILKELRSRRQIMDATVEQKQHLAEPLRTATWQTLRDMTTYEFALQSVYRRPAPAPLGDIAAVLELSAPLNGLLITSFSARTAEALAKQVFAEVHEDMTPALVLDCMGEITNVIAGQAKALLHGTPYHFSFSPPLVQTGAELKPPAEMDTIVLAFDSDVGGCAVQLGVAR